MISTEAQRNTPCTLWLFFTLRRFYWGSYMNKIIFLLILILINCSVAQDVIDLAVNVISDNNKDDTQRDEHKNIINANSLMDYGEIKRLLAYDQTLSLSLKCLRPNTIYTYESRLIPFWNISENMNSLRFSFYFEVKYKWDKYHHKSYAALYIAYIQVVLSGEQFKLEKPDQMGRIYLSFPGTFKYEFKNDIFGDFEFRGANMEVDGKYDFCEYRMDDDNKLNLLSCDKAKFSFEIIQNKW